MIKIFIDKEHYKKFIITSKSVILHINEQEDTYDGVVYVTADEFSVRLFHDEDDRGRIVSAIIKTKYPQDEMDAVRNNYELVRDGTAGDKEEEYTQRYNDMQSWRAYAKSYANEIINSLSEN